jgi:Neuraminidase (sialidase)
VFTAQKPATLIVKSTDGGHTFSPAGTVMTNAQQPAFFGNPFMAATSYHGSTAIAVVFEGIAQGTAGSQDQLRDIYYVNSTDGGSTWSTPSRLTDDDIGTDLGNKFVPGVAASPNGRFDAAWIDFRNDNGNLLSDTYYASSTDGGTTWSKNIKVSDQPSNRHYGQFANYSDIRSNVNVASNNYAANIVWDDTRNASSTKDAQDIYFGAVQQAAIPASTSTTVLYIIIAVAAGLVLAALILVILGVVVRSRRGAGTPKPPVSTTAS